MFSCCTGCCADDAEDRLEHTPRNSDDVGRPLLRMRWSRGNNGASSSGDEAKASLVLEGGMTFRMREGKEFGRYSLSHEVGRGAHCMVWRCVRLSKSGEPRVFALKVHTEETSAFKREMAALKKFDGVSCGGGVELFPRFMGTVKVQGRTGIAMPLYGPDLYVLQKMRERKPFPQSFVWAVASQLLGALEALVHAGLVHADIKPQNVVLQDCSLVNVAENNGNGHNNPDLDHETHVVLIDLGSCLTTEQLATNQSRITYVQSRWYRAPEVLLWSPISHPADAWSVGCVIAEVAVGVPIVPGESEYNQLARIYAMLGPPPPALLMRARRADEFFESGEDGAGPDGGGALLREERAADEPPIVRYLPHDELIDILENLVPYSSEAYRDALIILLDGLLRWDPLERWSGGRLMQRLQASLESQGVAWSNPAQGVVLRSASLARI